MRDELMESVIMNYLADGLYEYVENYLLKKNGGGKLKLKPSYDVDYEISEEILAELMDSFDEGDLSCRWHIRIGMCRNINELPPAYQELIIQYLPRFLEEHPLFRNEPCLKSEKILTQKE